MFANAIFIEARNSFKNDQMLVLRNTRSKKKKIALVNLLRSYRTGHILENVVKTFLLGRCLKDFNLTDAIGRPTKISKNIERRVVRSFHYLLNSTSPQDVVVLEYLLKQCNSNTLLYNMLDMRILEHLICSRQVTLPLLKSTHYAAQSASALNGQWKNLKEYVIVNQGIRNVADAVLAQACHDTPIS